MTKKELLKDAWVKQHYGDECHPNYINEAFIDGVDYGERKTIEKAIEWIKAEIFGNIHRLSSLLAEDSETQFQTVQDYLYKFKKDMEGE